MLVDSCIVHKDGDLLRLGVLVDSQFLQCTVQVVVENYMVGTTLSDLCRDNAVECHCRDHRERVVGLLLASFRSLKQRHLHGQVTDLSSH